MKRFKEKINIFNENFLKLNIEEQAYICALVLVETVGHHKMVCKKDNCLKFLVKLVYNDRHIYFQYLNAL